MCVLSTCHPLCIPLRQSVWMEQIVYGHWASLCRRVQIHMILSAGAGTHTNYLGGGGSKVKCHSWGISLFFSFWKFVRPTTVIYAYKEPRSAVDYISEFCSWLFSIYRTCYRTCRTYFPHNCRPPGFIYFYEDLFAARRFYIYADINR